MKQITPYPLWVGHAGEGRNFRRLFDAGIHAVVDVAVEEAPTTLPRELIYLRIPLVDGTGNPARILTFAVQTLATLVRAHVSTLVMCGAGMGRAPAVAAAALSIVHQQTPEDALKEVIHQSAHDVAPGFWTELIAALEHLPAGSQ